MTRLLTAAGIVASSPRPAAYKGAATSGVSTTTSATCATPAAFASGDILLAVAALSLSTDQLATPDGWTRAGTVSSQGSSANIRSYLFWKTATGSETGVTVTKSVGTVNSWRVTMTAWRGALGVDTVAANASTASDGTAVLPSVTPVYDQSSLVGLVTWGGTTSAPAPGRWLGVYNDGANPATGAFRRQPVPATASATASPTTGGAQKWTAYTVALLPPYTTGPRDLLAETGDTLAAETNDTFTTEQ